MLSSGTDPVPNNIFYMALGNFDAVGRATPIPLADLTHCDEAFGGKPVIHCEAAEGRKCSILILHLFTQWKLIHNTQELLFLSH